MNKVYILGGAQTDFERNWKKEGKSMIALLKEAIADGLSNSGISYDDVKESYFFHAFLHHHHVSNAHDNED